MIKDLRRALARRIDPDPRRTLTPEEAARRAERQARRAARLAELEHGEARAVSGINSYAFALSEKQIDNKRHRKRVGKLWDEVGQLQRDFLVKEGLRPEHRLLDVGCGALRAGIHLAKYLEPGHYYGIDINESLLRAAIEHEIPEAGLQDRLPVENLRATSTFEADFGVPFDMAIAQSVFSHLPLNHLRLCLWQLAKVMPPGGRFFATAFIAGDDVPYDADVKQVVHTTRPERDPFHYHVHELEWAATVAEWDCLFIGKWKHPRGQQMVEFRRR